MSELNHLQEIFQNFLMHDNDEIFKCVINTHKVPVKTRLSIYKNAYQSRLQEALAANYPVLRKYLGDEQFTQLAVGYIDTYPSSFQSIRWFGDNLVDFLKGSAVWQTSPYLAELAEFEWTCGLVFDALNTEFLLIDEMATVPPDMWSVMSFKARSSVKCLQFSWNIVEIWHGLTEDPPIAIEPKYSSTPITWLLWRQDLACQFISLANDEAWAITAMMQGATFGEICEGISQWYNAEDAGLRAASLLKGWIMAELIESVIY